VAVTAALILPVRAASAELAGDASLERLRQATSAHPDDPDLAWMLARALASGGDPEAALGALREFRERWPGSRPEADRTLGRLLYETGRDREAVAVLRDHLARFPDDAVGQFYLGLALRRLGEPDQAAEALERAAALEPAFAASSLRLRGLDRLQAGDAEEGQRLIERARGLDPDAAQTPARGSARAGGSNSPSSRSWEIFARGGLEFDSNVTLESDLLLTTVQSDREDLRYLWSGGVVWRPLQRERVGLIVGYRYDESRHREIDAFDQRSHLAFAAVLWRTAERISLRLDGRFLALDLDGSPYLHAESIQPNLFWALPRRAGVLRSFARFERREFRDTPFLDSLERDGIVYGGGLEHILPLGFRRGAWVAVQASFDRTETDADRDLFGFEGAYDNDRLAGKLALYCPLPWRLDVRSTVYAGRELYRNPNVVDMITDDGVGTLDPRKRRDWLIEGRLSIGRRLGRFLRLELGYRGTRRISNVDVYGYDRHVVGLYIRATTG
jgi:tetratricopeptide (TPR) repeat protein